MKIALSGPSCSGKTSVLEALKKGGRFEGHIFIEEVAKKMKDIGVKINEEGDNETQLFILSEHLKNLLHPDFITDRCLLDGFVYTDYAYTHNKVSKHVFDYYHNTLNSFINFYDFIFFFPPILPLEQNELRSDNETFLKEIEKLFCYYVSIFTSKGKANIITLKDGTIEDRVKEITNFTL